ncbi:MAG: hypothetical protein ABSA49_07360 [Rhizomicrobium sp.]
MNWKSLTPVSLGALFIAAGASAATQTTTVPTLSGTYAYSYSAFCQPTVLVNYNSGGTPYVINLGGSGKYAGWGDIRFEGGTLTFNSTKMTVTYSATDVEGSPVLLQSSGGGPDNLEGTPVAQATLTGKTTFANTSATVTLSGQAYNAAYGAVTGGGIAEYVSLVGLDSNGCANQWTLSRV